VVKPEWLGTASGVRAASMGGVNSEGRDFINWHAIIAMMSSIAEWPPVSGHPAMEVAIKVQFRRARQRGTREVGVRCSCLCLRRCLAFLVILIVFQSVAFLV
jgi:hypothetical protein